MLGGVGPCGCLALLFAVLGLILGLAARRGEAVLNRALNFDLKEDCVGETWS